MTSESKPAYEWVGLAVDVVLILVGAAMIAWGWTGFGSTVLIISLVGLVVSVVRLLKMARRPPAG